MIALIALTVIYTIGSSLFVTHGLNVPESMEVLSTFAFRLILAWWVREDRQARGYRVPYEFEAFVFFAWPFVLPYYLYRTRRGWGLVVFAGFLAIVVAPSVVAALLRPALSR